MKLTLTEDVPNLGTLGDTVEVKPGYGRNYLLPQGMALLAGGKASKELRHRLQYLEKMREGKIALAREKAEKLAELKLEVSRRAGLGGRLFGSVTNRDLLELLKQNGFEFERRAVQLSSPARNVGIHEFTVRIHAEVSLTMQIKIVAEAEKNAEPKAPAAAPAATQTEEMLEETDFDSEEFDETE